MPLTPKNRKEEWLKGFVEHETTLTPKNREEEWTKGLIEGSTTLTPKNRCEEWLKEIIDASGGGGGSSDFSIANVTFINNLGYDASLTVSIAYDEGEMGEGAPAVTYPYANIPEGTSTYHVILYKGNSLFDATGFNVTLTGDITTPFEGVVMVSGDGTVTLAQ